MSITRIKGPYLLFLGAVRNPLDAKTGRGLKDWRPELCLGQSRLPGCSVDLGLPDMTPARAYEAGARSLVIGVAPLGGDVSPEWVDTLVEALEAGLDLVSGMHSRLGKCRGIDARQSLRLHGGSIHVVLRHFDKT